ncbi:MAG: zinc-dependent alcohol dehydrogenase [Halanaerobiales bacterium]
MKAARFTGDGNIKIIERKMPDRKKGEALVKVKACGLCGSEKRQLQQGTDIIPGHEIAGKVIETDSDSYIKNGTRVALYLPYYCGECYYCTQGQTNLCQNITHLLGHSIDGGYAEYITVKEENLIPLDPNLSYEAGVLLLDTIGTTHHGLRIARAENNDIALVIGCGPIGLGTIFGLRNMGVGKIYATDLIPYRLKIAENLGAVPLNVDDINLIEYFRGNYPEGIPLVIDCVGAPFTLKDAVRVVRGGGKIVVTGEYWEDWTLKPHSDFMLKDWQLIRSWYFPVTEINSNMEILKYNPKIVNKIISHRFSLKELDRAFEMFLNRETAKVIIKYD